MATTPTTTTTTPPSTPVVHGPVNYDNLNESWCELQYKSGCSSTGSISHLHHSVNPEVLEKLLQEAQKESQSPSPPSPPHLSPILDLNHSKCSLIDSASLSSTSSSSSAYKLKSSLTMSNKSSTLSYFLNPNDSSTPILVDLEASTYLSSPIKLESPRSSLFDHENTITTTIATTNITTHIANTNATNTFQAANSKTFKSTNSAFECSECIKHKKQIDILLERQIDQEKQIIKLRKDYEDKLLAKSPEFMISSQSSISTSSITEEQDNETNNKMNNNPIFMNQAVGIKSSSSSLTSNNQNTTTSAAAAVQTTATYLRQNSSTTTLISPNNNNNTTTTTTYNNNINNNNKIPITSSSSNTPNSNASSGNNSNSNELLNLGCYNSGIYKYNYITNRGVESAEWMKYWSSRPQVQPPKEWNFVHPVNSSKLNCIRKETGAEDTNIIRKFLNKESIGKFIFTHMASFIVGATLMFLVLKRHLNLRSSIYFV